MLFFSPLLQMHSKYSGHWKRNSFAFLPNSALFFRLKCLALSLTAKLGKDTTWIHQTLICLSIYFSPSQQIQTTPVSRKLVHFSSLRATRTRADLLHYQSFWAGLVSAVWCYLWINSIYSYRDRLTDEEFYRVTSMI